MNLGTKIGAILGRATIWALAGALFGGVFFGLHEVFGTFGGAPWLMLTLAVALAGAVTSAFFGAMQVAVLGTMVGVLVGIVFLMLAVDPERPMIMLGAAMGAGLVAGSFYSGSSAIRSRPLGQTVSGLLAGCVAGPILHLLAASLGFGGSMLLLAALAVSLVGIFYLIASRWVLSLCSEWMSAKMSGPVVAGLVAAAVATSMWLIGGSVTGGVELPEAALGERLLPVTQSLIGGALGGAIGGAVLEILGIDRSDYHV